MNASGLRLSHESILGLVINLWDVFTLLIIFNGQLYYYAYVSLYLPYMRLVKITGNSLQSLRGHVGSSQEPQAQPPADAFAYSGLNVPVHATRETVTANAVRVPNLIKNDTKRFTYLRFKYKSVCGNVSLDLFL
jgi:hypothetical protein